MLHDSEDTLKYQLKRMSNQINAQAEREVNMALTIAANTDKVYRQECQLSNYAQQLSTARARATTADLADIELGLLKAQLIAVLRLLRMRRELNHGAVTGLAPPSAQEIEDFAKHFGVSDLSKLDDGGSRPGMEAVRVFIDPLNGAPSFCPTVCLCPGQTTNLGHQLPLCLAS
eukprot:SAG22_NODE_434_length_10555_cov_3.917559_5_plen_173_part_00